MLKLKDQFQEDTPFVQAHNVGPKQRPTAIVLRTSFTSGDAGAAFGIAQAWHHSYNRIDSCHYVIDEFQVLHCVPDRLQSKSVYTQRFNRRAITINVCHDPPSRPTNIVLDSTAEQVARLCRLHRIRLRLLNEDQQRRWVDYPWRRRGGIIIATSGDFPTSRFFELVQQNY